MTSRVGSRNAVEVRSVAVGGGEPFTAARLGLVTDGLTRPAALSGLCAGVEAVGSWTLQRLLELERDRVVPVEHYPSGDRRERYEIRQMPLGDFAAEVSGGEPDTWFLAGQDLDQVFPSAARELPALPLLPDDARSVMRSVFFGVDTASATHFHTRDHAVLVQVTGTKRVVLAPPSASRVLATNSSFGGRPQYSRLGPEPGGDAAAFFADLLGAGAQVVDLAPGDGLFIPVHWWHWAESRGESLSVTTFWRARLRDWTFPRPGFRAAAAVTVGSAIAGARRIAGRLRRP